MAEQEKGRDDKIVDFGERWRAKHPDESLPDEAIRVSPKEINDFMDSLEQQKIPITKAMDCCNRFLHSSEMLGLKEAGFKVFANELATKTLAQLAQRLVRLQPEEINNDLDYVTVLCRTFERAFHDELTTYLRSPHPTQPTDSSLGEDERIHR